MRNDISAADCDCTPGGQGPEGETSTVRHLPSDYRGEATPTDDVHRVARRFYDHQGQSPCPRRGVRFGR